ncbi:MAG: hypothetical protein J3Q66DRAFT_430994 [Benniella sp.]|nr:MAG: hypothetical protein J3Q66DRAFT_430994 [Benniella sp.]
MADLEVRLQEADKAGARLKLIVTDGVFSMDAGLIYRNNCALIFVDDCHSTGSLDPMDMAWQGIVEFRAVHIVNSTLDK